jgi:hypothetical protein
MKTHEESAKQLATMTARLRAAYPTVYGNCHFAHDEGWEAILMDLGAKAEKLGASFTYIKEKYATLNMVPTRISDEPFGGTPEVQAIVKEAIDRSGETCEQCGKPGRRVYSKHLWEATACEECQGDSRPMDDRDDYDYPDYPDTDDYEPDSEDLARAREAGCGDEDIEGGASNLDAVVIRHPLVVDPASAAAVVERTQRIVRAMEGEPRPLAEAITDPKRWETLDDAIHELEHYTGSRCQMLVMCLLELRGRYQVERFKAREVPLSEEALAAITERAVSARVPGFALDNDADIATAYQALDDLPVLIEEIRRLRVKGS